MGRDTPNVQRPESSQRNGGLWRRCSDEGFIIMGLGEPFLQSLLLDLLT